MQAFTYQQHNLTQTNCLIEALAFARVPILSCPSGKKPYVVAVTGSGGKTSLICQLAREAADLGQNVLIATTTHMARPHRYGVFTADTDQIIAQMERDHVVVAGLPVGTEKIGFIGQDVYSAASAAADMVLVEADGSKRLPLKAFGTHEPVIPDNVDAVLCVAGLSALGQNLQDVFFRLDVAEQLIQANLWSAPPDVVSALSADKAIVTPLILGYLWQQSCLLPLPKKLPINRRDIPIVPVLNQADTEDLILQGCTIFENQEIATGLITRCR